MEQFKVKTTFIARDPFSSFVLLSRLCREIMEDINREDCAENVNEGKGTSGSDSMLSENKIFRLTSRKFWESCKSAFFETKFKAGVH